MIEFNVNSIRALRESLKLSGAQFADKLGISRQHVYMLEKGQHSPTAKTLVNIMNAFDIEPGLFFQRKLTSAFKLKVNT